MSEPTLACSSCGVSLTADQRTCPQCGATSASFGTPDNTGGAKAAGASETLTGSPWETVGQRLRLSLVGEFDVMGILGQGGMAAVFLAHEYALNRKVALKVMSPALMMGEGMIERFRQEAVTQANLQHANIVAMHGVRSVEELEFFVMQFVPGRTLQRALRSEQDAKRPLHTDVVRSFLAQTGAALTYAHRRGVIHRDVKPGNILLNADGDAVVTDFGIAKISEHPSVTLTGSVVGTPAYMSPEQCWAQELSPTSDQYSLGIVAYELLTGRVPFSGTGFVIMQAHTSQEPPPIRSLRPDCPPDVEAAVMRMLAKSADDRFETIPDALQALGAIPAGTRSDDPIRRELLRLADVKGVEEKLADILRGPASPTPQSRRSSGQAPVRISGASTPVPPAFSATQILEGAAARGADGAAPPTPGSGAMAASQSSPVPRQAAAPPTRQRVWALAAFSGAAAVALAVWLATRPPDSPAAESEPAVSDPATQDEPSASRDSAAPPPPVPQPGTEGRFEIVAPRSTSLVVGDRLRLSAAGDSLTARGSVRWESQDPRVMRLDARTGAARAVAPGLAVVIATVGSARDSLTFSVSEPGTVPKTATPAIADPPAARVGESVVRVERVDMPAPMTLHVGDTIRLAAVPRDPQGGRAAVPTSWSVDRDEVLSVSQAGAGVARAPGLATVVATAAGTRGVVVVTVVPREAVPPPAPVPPAADASRAKGADSDDAAVAGALRAVNAYFTAVATRDTGQVHRTLPSVSAQSLRQWQDLYDATERVRSEVLETRAADPVPPSGGTMRFQVQWRISYTVRGERRERGETAQYTATARREGGSWVLVSVDKR